MERLQNQRLSEDVELIATPSVPAPSALTFATSRAAATVAFGEVPAGSEPSWSLSGGLLFHVRPASVQSVGDKFTEWAPAEPAKESLVVRSVNFAEISWPPAGASGMVNFK